MRGALGDVDRYPFLLWPVVIGERMTNGIWFHRAIVSSTQENFYKEPSDAREARGVLSAE